MHFENTELRRAMKALGFTNHSLADALSAVRSDNQRTSPATVSRWVSGAAPVEPALVLYLKERLKFKLLEKPFARLPKCISIAIGGNKGGSGGSAVTALFALAAANIGYRVGYVATKESHPGFTKSTCPPNVTWLADFDKVDKSTFDFVFTDVASRTFFLPAYEAESSRILLSHDLVLVPCQLDRDIEVDITLKVIEHLENAEDSPAWSLLPFSSCLDIQRLVELAPTYAQWHPHIVPTGLIHSGKFFLLNPFGRYEFADNEIETLSFVALRDSVERVGIELSEPSNVRNLSHATLGELLDLLCA